MAEGSNIKKAPVQKKAESNAESKKTSEVKKAPSITLDRLRESVILSEIIGPPLSRRGGKH